MNKFQEKPRFLLKRHFTKLSQEMPTLYKDIEGGKIKDFLMTFWGKQNSELEKLFIFNTPFDFLSNEIIRNTMFVTSEQGWVPIELPTVEKVYRKYLPNLARESQVGNPPILKDVYNSSSNVIHHLYHFAKFEQSTKHRLSEINSIVEWGGGYGNMAKLYKRLNPKGTYTIIDTGLFSALQWLYLSTVMSTSSVNVVRHKSDRLADGMINILPLRYLKNNIPNSDLFISTWGLSESTKYAQDFVVNNDWFGAKMLLLGYQKSTSELSHATRLGQLAKKAGAKIHETEFIKNNYYAFK